MTADLVHVHDFNEPKIGLVKHASTTSLIIAEKFDKRHRDVLKAIRNLECSEEFSQRNFALRNYQYETGRKQSREAVYYEITRDGFAFLAMGFTGKEAAAWKEKFIAAFNALEALALERLQSDAQWEADHVEQAQTYWFKKRKHWKPIYDLLVLHSMEPRQIAGRIGKSVASIRRAIHRMIEVGILHPRLVREAIQQSAFARSLTRSGVMDVWGGKAKQIDMFNLVA